MWFGILGETQARHDDGTEVPLGGPARRALLALLLVSPGAVVPAERLAEEIEPGGAVSAHALQSQVSRLRTALGPAAPIERVGAGYRIAVPEDAVDAARFEARAAAGRAALTAGDPARAAAELRRALELWRGPALAGLDGSETARAAAARLEEARLSALEDRIEAELRLGGHRSAVPELRELTARHPLRERPAGLLMRALSAQGSQTEALVVFEQTRRHLAEELGADPSAELTSLHAELLDTAPAPGPAAPPAQLTSFVGREEEAAEATALLRQARLVTLTGPGGVGKTRLAVEVAATAAAAGVCFVELAALPEDGPSEPPAGDPGPGRAARSVLAALGLRENGLQLGDGPPRTALDRLTAALTDRPLLLVLDNCEHVVDEAAALAARLLAACPRLRVLATSREPLGVIGEHVRQVRPLGEAAAVRLFTDRARAVRRGPTGDPELVRRICAALDGLPLAIELAAARLRTLEPEDLAGRLDDLLGITARGSRTSAERHRTMRAVVAWSWDLLTDAEQRAARRFTVFAGGAGGDAAREVCGTDADTLESLADKSLLETAGAGRLRMLETIRAYGTERLEEAGEGEATRRGHARHLLELHRHADPHLLRAGQLRWLPRLAAEHDNLLAALRWAVGAHERRTALELLAAASTSLWIRGASAAAAPYALALLTADEAEPGRLDGEDLGEEYAACVLLAASTPAGRPLWQRHRTAALEALAAAWPGDRPGRYPVVPFLWMMRTAGETDRRNTPHARDAFALVSSQHDCPDPWARAAARYVAGYATLGEGDADGAERAFEAAADLFRGLGDRWGTALALDALADLAAGRADREGAIALTDRALALTGELGAVEDSADLLVNRGDHHLPHDPAAAREDYSRAADLARGSGSPAALAAALRGLGDIALLEGRPQEAERLYADALDRIDPHWVKSLGNRLRCLAGLGRTAEARGDRAAARTHYDGVAAAVSALGPSVPDALRLLGLPEELVTAVGAR
ncbi:BTAD domain-containing putative transcriptional regulator [Streptomyces lavendulae]|uniref:BTAD domain-containing putative transcriptional regulator n=1 Tax=Streptomyces lavendulae TaxID=1914 RepID=UPI0024A10955|nr:BTAD domain-containing putative transcriptional regulator [Streptomyces lavendulae]GLX21481.1 SARP family transcriptional regulator [Streptomyces lavendulae subsp. lavendulae]GLX28898.1 SARP family transcriptional regulator [Streptomyces lavendulae subsp. lavendulae]